MRRRMVLAGLPILALATQRAVAATADLSLSCDTTLAPALCKAAAAYRVRTGVQVFVFATSPALILPQLERDIQNDIVVTQTAILQGAASAGVIASPVAAQWSNSLTVAGTRNATTVDGPVALVDATASWDIDGAALLAALGIRPARTIGAHDTNEVAFLLTSGTAQAGLLCMTDVRAHEGLTVIRPVPSAVQPPLLYAASVTRLAQRPNPDAFVAWLAGEEAAVILTGAGLEKAT